MDGATMYSNAYTALSVIVIVVQAIDSITDYQQDTVSDGEMRD